MKFKMENSSTGQNCSVLAVYALSNYVLLTDCIFTSSCTVFNKMDDIIIKCNL